MAHAATFPAAGSARVAAGRSTRSSSWAGLRLTARGRVALMVLSTLFLLAVVVVSGRMSAEAGTTSSGPATASVVVERGQSLWEIATRIAPHTDPRDVVTVIRELNGLGDTTVVAGQSIVVPRYDDAS